MYHPKVIANFSHLFLIFKFFGLCYFSISNSCFSNIYQKWRLIQVILIFAGSLYVVIDLSTNDDDKGKFSLIYSIVNFLQLSSNFATLSTAVLSSFLKSKVEENLFFKFDQIDDLIKNEFSIHIQDKKYKFGRCILVFMSIYFIRIYYRWFESLKKINFIMYIGYALMVIVMKLFVMKYYIIVQLLNYRLQMFTNIINIVQNSKSTSDIKQILTIKRVHSLILDVVGMINECFGLTLLILFINLFITLTNKTYVLFLSLNKILKNKSFFIGKLNHFY